MDCYTKDMTCDDCLKLLENVYSNNFDFNLSNINSNDLDLHIKFPKTEIIDNNENRTINEDDIVNEIKNFKICKNELFVKYQIIMNCVKQHVHTLCELNDLLHEKKKTFIHRMQNIMSIEKSLKNLESYDHECTYSNLRENTSDIKNDMCADFFQAIEKHKFVYDNSKNIITQTIHFFNSNNTTYNNIKCKKTCTICQINELSHFTIPCGHTFCKECCDKMTTYCFFCRQHILKKTALYF